MSDIFLLGDSEKEYVFVWLWKAKIVTKRFDRFKQPETLKFSSKRFRPILLVTKIALTVL